MKKIKSFTLMCIIGVLCITQVKAQYPDIGAKIPNQLDSLIKESIIMSHNIFFEQENRKPYFIVKDGIPPSFEIDSLAKELGVQVITFGEFRKKRIMGNYTKPNGTVVAKNFAKDFRFDLKKGTGINRIMELRYIIVDNTYIYISISIPMFNKTSKGWRCVLDTSTTYHYCYEYSPKEKKWDLVDAVNSSVRRVLLPNKEIIII